jgi:hypothetical protein
VQALAQPTRRPRSETLTNLRPARQLSIDQGSNPQVDLIAYVPPGPVVNQRILVLKSRPAHVLGRVGKPGLCRSAGAAFVAPLTRTPRFSAFTALFPPSIGSVFKHDCLLSSGEATSPHTQEK